MSASLASRRKRAAAYIQKMGPAIQGEHGDDHTYKVAAVLSVDFALPPGVALEVFSEWNTTCQPPWRERDLIAKLHGAAKYGRHQRGGKLEESTRLPGTIESADDALDALLYALKDHAPHDVVGWLLYELDSTLKWKRAPRKGAPDHRKIPRGERQAALLSGVGSYLLAESPPSRAERIPWILAQAAREHFNCYPPPSANRTEIRFDIDVIDAMATPGARNGHSRSSPLLTDGEESAADRAQLIHPDAQIPEDDPETLCARKEMVERFRASLSPLEQHVFDHFSESDKVIALRVGASWKSVKTARQRVRDKARGWADAASEQDAARRAA